MKFNTTQVRGWLLIACAIHGIFFFVITALNFYENLSFEIPFIATEIVFSLFHIFGLLVIQFGAPLKRVGLMGLILMIIHPTILLSFYIPLLAQNHYRIQSLLSIPRIPILYMEPTIYFIPYFGYLLIGWLTIKTKEFSVWAGTALILSGILYIATFYFGMVAVVGSLHKSMLIGATLTESLALAMYGKSVLKPRNPL